MELPVPIGRLAEAPLHVRDDVDGAASPREVPHRQLPEFERFPLRDEDEELRPDIMVRGFDDRVSDAVTAEVFLRPRTDGLPPRRPEMVLLVAQIDVLPPIVPDQVLFPPGDAVELGVGAPAVASAGLGNRQAVITVADDIDPGARRPGRGDDVFAAVGGEMSRSEEHTSELQSLAYLVCRLLLEKKK